MASNHTASQAFLTENFLSAAKKLTTKNFLKSYAQVATSVAPVVSPPSALSSVAGHRPIAPSQQGSRSYGLKLRHGELDILREKAKALRMSVNALIRAKALGEDYIEKPPDWLRDILLKLYVELAAQGNNLNQLTRKVNAGLATAESTIGIVDHHRQPVFELMKHIELALAGRKPPDDY